VSGVERPLQHSLGHFGGGLDSQSFDSGRTKITSNFYLITRYISSIILFYKKKLFRSIILVTSPIYTCANKEFGKMALTSGLVTYGINDPTIENV